MKWHSAPTYKSEWLRLFWWDESHLLMHMHKHDSMNTKLSFSISEKWSFPKASTTDAMRVLKGN